MTNNTTMYMYISYVPLSVVVQGMGWYESLWIQRVAHIHQKR